jgi:hypothetical protein
MGEMEYSYMHVHWMLMHKHITKEHFFLLMSFTCVMNLKGFVIELYIEI